MTRSTKIRRTIAVTAVLAVVGIGLAAPAQAASRVVRTPAECESAARGGYTCDYTYLNEAGTEITDYGRDLIVARAEAAVFADVDYGPTTGWGHSDDGPGPTTASGRAASVVSLTNANAKMDCSGLTRYAYGAVGLDIEWTKAKTGSGTWDPGSANQPDRFTKISASAAKKGDLVWWSGHVAIFVSSNKIVESWNPGGAREVAFHSSGYTKANATFYRIKPAYLK